MIWYKAESGNSIKPAETDTTSSKKWNYIRKDFEFFDPVSDQGEVIIPGHWEWLEAKVLKNDWETFQKVLGHDESIEDCQNALIELAEMIVEG